MILYLYFSCTASPSASLFLESVYFGTCRCDFDIKSDSQIEDGYYVGRTVVSWIPNINDHSAHFRGIQRIELRALFDTKNAHKAINCLFSCKWMDLGWDLLHEMRQVWRRYVSRLVVPPELIYVIHALTQYAWTP